MIILTIRKLLNSWDNENKDLIDENFEFLGGIEGRSIKAMMEKNPGNLTPTVNGLPRKVYDGGSLTTNNYGIQFTAKVNGVISGCYIYSLQSGTMVVGLASKNHGQIETEIISEQIISITAGWNKVNLALPIEQNKSYLLYKRNTTSTLTLASKNISPWASNGELMSNALAFSAGGELGKTGGYQNYAYFWDIEVITSLAQIFYVMNRSVVRESDIYVGNNPPAGSRFWFKPLQ